MNKKDNPHLLKQSSLDLINLKWKTQLHIYTDGSKDPQSGTSAAAFWVPALHIKKAKRLNNHTSSYRAELAAIMLALTWLEDADLHSGAVIFSDSLSSLLAIKQQKEEHFVLEIIIKVTHLYFRNINICLEWIPSHCGIMGNEIADLNAKQALKYK